MTLFVQKMYQLFKIRQCSLDGSGIQMNDRQRKLLYTSTKYVTLLSFAMVSTWMALAYGAFVNWFGDSIIRARTVVIIDMDINIVCMYLQFAFNRKYYDKYCVCFGSCCSYFMDRKFRRSHQTVMKMDKEINLGNNIVVMPPTPIRNLEEHDDAETNSERMTSINTLHEHEQEDKENKVQKMKPGSMQRYTSTAL